MSDNKDFQAPPWWKQTKDDYTKYRSAGTSYTVDDLIGRKDSGRKDGPFVYKSPRTALAFESGDLVKSFTITTTAILKRIILEMPSFTSAVVTGAISIENSDGLTIYEKTDMAENDTHVRLTDEHLVGENTVKVTLSADPQSSGICYITLYLEGD